MKVTRKEISKVSASFFEKKEAKKLSLTAGRGRAGANARRTESFLLLFFKKEALP
jgi:ribosomal protein L15